MSQSIIILILALILSLANIVGGRPSRDDPRGTTIPVAVVQGTQVLVHAEPAGSETVATLSRGDHVTVTGRDGDWYRVRLADGREGYVRAYFLQPLRAHAGQRRASPVVLGYVVHDRGNPSLPSLQANADVLTAIAPWTWGLDGEGNLQTVYLNTVELGNVLRFAGSRGMHTYALVHNYRSGRGFDPEIARRVLGDPEVSARAVANIVRAVRDWGMSGAHVDFENVPHTERENLLEFMRQLAAALRAEGLQVTMAVPARAHGASPTSDVTGAYDYAALAGIVDYLAIMTYDQHWRGGRPGPVASITWVESVVRYALDVGVPPDKLLLGVALYGYDWPADRSRWADPLSHAEVLARLAAAGERDPSVALRWDPVARVPYVRYDGREIWFENHQSLSHKLHLVNRYGLAGISMWRLGQEDPEMWTVIRAMLGG